MALGRADEELGVGEEEEVDAPRRPPQRAPRPPSLLSFLRGGSAGRRRWRRRERDVGGPSGAEQRMWLMGSDDDDEEDEDESPGEGLLFASPMQERATGWQVPPTPSEGTATVVVGESETKQQSTASTADGSTTDTPPPDPGDVAKGWSVLLRKKGEGGEGRSGGRRFGGIKMIGSGLSGPWAFGVFAVTGQVAGEVSGPCAVASLAVAALAAIVAGLCHAELEDAVDAPRPGPRDYTTVSALSSSSSSHSDSQHSDDEEEERNRSTTNRPPSAQPPQGRRPPTTKRSLLCGWTSVLGHAATVAVACRALSASMDYITGGRVRRASEERFGALPAVLGASSPDVLAVGVTILPTVLFVLGLEPWSGLRTMLNMVVATSVVFFVGAGSLETDPGNWAHGFLPAGFSGLVSGSAMSTLGFVGLHAVVAEGRRERALAAGGGGSSGVGRRKPVQRNTSNSFAVAVASAISLLVAFMSYFAVATVLTMMVQFRSLSAGTPLVQAFEVRDVDWARLVMASLGIAALALALVEASPPLHRATVALSAPDGLLPRRFAREHPKTATPALAILGSGILASALALVGDPLALLRLSSAAPLLAHALSAVDLIHRRYQPDGGDDNNLSERPEGKTNRRTQTTLPPEVRTKITVKTIKDGLAFLKRDAAGEEVVYESLPTAEIHANGKPHHSPAGAEAATVDKEPLLNSAQDSDPIEAGGMASSSDDGGGGGGEGEAAGSGLSGYESDSSTDIDAIVEEYKERLKVATLDGGPGGMTDPSAAQAEPSAATGKRVVIAVSGLLACSLAVGVAILLLASGIGASAVALAAASSFVAFLLLALVARQPQKRREDRQGSFRVPLVPWVPGISLIMHVGLLIQVLATAWIPFALWAVIGCFLYYWKKRCRRANGATVEQTSAPGWGPRSGRARQHPCHRRLREQVRLRPPPKHSVVSSLIPSHRRAPDESIRRLTQVDTILISR